MTALHTKPSTSFPAKSILAAALMTLCGTASAQSYTARVLPYPVSATGCVGSYAHLDDLGNVQGHCLFKQTNLSVLWFAFISGGRANDVEKTVIWRPTGLPQILLTYGKGFNTAGQAISDALRDEGTSKPLGVYSYWSGLTRKTVTSVPNLGSAWALMSHGARSVSKGGRAMLLTPPTTSTSLVNLHQQLAVLRDGAGATLPALPAACTPQYPQFVIRMVYAINDAGQVGTLAISRPDRSGDFSSLPTKHQACLWDGEQWLIAPPTPDISSVTYDKQSYDLEARSPLKLDISSKGELLMHTLNETAFTWKAGAATLTPADARAHFYGTDDQWIGGALPSDFYNIDQAAVWREGNPVDLNSVTTGIPADHVLITAVSANKKGQILAVALPKNPPTSRERVKLILLTPR